MLTGLLLFLLYTSLFLFILYRLSLASSFCLSYKKASLAFIVKIFAGCIYGYFFLHYYGGDDTWLYHNEALKQYALLKNDPLHFFINDIIPKGYNSNQFLSIFNSSDSFAKDIELTLLLKLFGIFDLLSGGRYYVNVIFYEALVFWGSYFLFKTFSMKYPENRKLWLLFIFYFPPLLFWSSGLRKDGICFSVFCGLIYQLYYLFEVKFSARRLLYFLCLFFLLFLIRNYVALCFIPVTIAYALIKQNKRHSFFKFSVILLFSGVMFFLTSFLPDGFNLPLKMAERQHAFLKLTGNSYLPINVLQGNVYSYTMIFPQAINHVFVRPYYYEARGMLDLFSFLELLFFFFVAIRAIIKPSINFKKLINDPLLLSVFAIALLNYIIIGYTVPFLGAIVRYKSLFEILLILVFIQLQDTNFIIKKRLFSV